MTLPMMRHLPNVRGCGCHLSGVFKGVEVLKFYSVTSEGFTDLVLVGF